MAREKGCVVTKYDKNISGLVGAIRKAAEDLKGKKKEVGEAVIAGIKETQRPFDAAAFYFRGIANLVDTVASVVRVITSQKEARELAQTLIGNVVHDLASRLNETASLVEFMSKDEQVSSAIQASASDFQKVSKILNKTSKTKTPKDAD